jgi:hypothetical protein
MSQPPKSSSSLALADLRRRFPDLRGLSHERTLELVATGLRTNNRGLGKLMSFAGRYAQERGCASLGPVQIGPSTWAYRGADGRTQIWHREPTPAERRACIRTDKNASRPIPASPAPVPASTSRVARLFGDAR